MTVTAITKWCLTETCVAKDCELRPQSCEPTTGVAIFNFAAVVESMQSFAG